MYAVASDDEYFAYEPAGRETRNRGNRGSKETGLLGLVATPLQRLLFHFARRNGESACPVFPASVRRPRRLRHPPKPTTPWISPRSNRRFWNRAGTIRQRHHNYLYCNVQHLYIAYQVSYVDTYVRSLARREISFLTGTRTKRTGRGKRNDTVGRITDSRTRSKGNIYRELVVHRHSSENGFTVKGTL